MSATLRLASALVAVALAVGLAACGGGSDSTSTPSTSGGSNTSTTETAPAQAKKGQSSQAKTQSKESPKEIHRSEAKEASDFAPKHHTDSGGGSKQFEVKGGDNSVQEFGGEADTSELDKAATVLHNFLDARAEKNWAAACTYMSKSMIQSLQQLAGRSQQLKGAGCAAIQEALSGRLPKSEFERAAKADVGSLRIEGERAFVIYRGVEGSIMAMSMAHEGGEWKVAALGGVPLN
jgi:hypothetical protein